MPPGPASLCPYDTIAATLMTTHRRLTETGVPCNYADWHPGHDPFDESSPDSCLEPTKTDRFGRCIRHPLSRKDRRNLDTAETPWKWIDPPLPQCEVPECTRMLYANGRCYAHDMRRYLGSADQDSPIGSLAGPWPRCSDPACSHVAHAEGRCWKHAYLHLVSTLPLTPSTPPTE